MNMALIEVEELEVRYGAKTAVSGLSFGVHGGVVYGLLGPNGAGKTSTQRTLAALRGRLHRRPRRKPPLDPKTPTSIYLARPGFRPGRA